MVKKIIVLFGILFVTLFLTGCLDNPTGKALGVCPQYQCIKTMTGAPSNSEPIELSGKGPTLFSGIVHPKIKIINPNNEPAKFNIVFTCENKYKNTKEMIEAGEVWLQPGGSGIVQGDFKVGAKENWECLYDVSASMINSCQLQQI